ncbi:hypothetical protein [Absidia glauca]|uniref:C2H2-type domain-containing protein n=1 Tax=Absidia glauca TaxID=4829 RepID=A0A163L0A7_ABSGL|nr:hypothetical protein [Absidia glauca]
MYSDSTLSVKDATGRHISLLNDHQQQQEQEQEQELELSSVTFSTKRKYHCAEPGCNKSFTTSGHLARHHRIHTGEKNFHCLHPGCHSRFSRQDNMMQHYRTHLSPKSRRQHQQQQPNLQKSKVGSTSNKEQPRLHCRTMIGSNEHSDLYPLVETKGADRTMTMMNDRYATAVTRSRRATTLPSSFHPYPSSLASATTNALSQSLSPSPPQQQHYHHHPSTTSSHWTPSSRPLTHSLPNLIKPLPMEPVSATSPTPMATSPTSMNNDGNEPFYSTSPNAYHHHHRNYYQPYHVSRRPQRAHSASSTCSTTSSSFLSPRPVNLSPPPLVDPTDVIYPKHFIQLPPPHLLQQDDQHHIVFPEQHHHHEQDLLGMTHAVSIFG